MKRFSVNHAKLALALSLTTAFSSAGHEHDKVISLPPLPVHDIQHVPYDLSNQPVRPQSKYGIRIIEAVNSSAKLVI